MRPAYRTAKITARVILIADVYDGGEPVKWKVRRRHPHAAEVVIVDRKAALVVTRASAVS